MARATLLLVSGVVITFTAALHDTVFAEVLFALSVLLVSGVEVLTYRLGKVRSRIPRDAVLRAVLALVAALVVLVTIGSFGALAITVIVWAAMTAIIDVSAGWKAQDVSYSRELRVTGILAGGLALLLVLIPGSPVSVIGLYGGYCFLVGVFLAIAAFDRQTLATTES